MELRIDSVADQIIVSALREGDHRQAATLLIKYYSNAVFSLCQARVEDQEIAEELTIRSFSAAFSKLQQFHSELPVPNWLIQIAGEQCLQAIHSEIEDDFDRNEWLQAVEVDQVTKPQRISESLRRRLEVLAAAL